MNKFILGIVLFCYSVAYAGSQQLSANVLEEINQYRVSKGLNRLVQNDFLNQLALEHSKLMARHKIPCGHDGFSQRVHAMQKHFPKFLAAAENVAYRYPTAHIVVDGWIHSPGHRQNILGKYTLTGIGIVYDEKGHPWYTQIFLKI